MARIMTRLALCSVLSAAAVVGICGCGEDRPAAPAAAPATTQTAPAAPASQPAASAGIEKMTPLKLDLPRPMFIGTPKNLRSGNMPPKDAPKDDPIRIPAGVANVARDKDVTAGTDEIIIGELEYVTDGDKEAGDGQFVELAPGTQWVQIDLGAAHDVFAIAIWHDHSSARVYRDVVVQLSSDAYFIDKTTVFNNDHDNSSNLGRGKDYEYVETNQGRAIGVAGVKARYVRIYSNGSTAGGENAYTEVEVFARPVK